MKVYKRVESDIIKELKEKIKEKDQTIKQLTNINKRLEKSLFELQEVTKKYLFQWRKVNNEIRLFKKERKNHGINKT